MKLYYVPGASSLAVHVVLRELAFAFELERVDLARGVTADGRPYARINPMGYVPALQLESGEVLREAQVILQYLADRRPEAGLLAPVPMMARYRSMQWLAFLSTEIHKAFAPLFQRGSTFVSREVHLAVIGERLGHVETHLPPGSFLLGDRFDVADAYLFAVLGWTAPVGLDLRPWPRLRAYATRVGTRPSVVAAMQAEREGERSA